MMACVCRQTGKRKPRADGPIPSSHHMFDYSITFNDTISLTIVTIQSRNLSFKYPSSIYWQDVDILPNRFSTSVTCFAKIDRVFLLQKKYVNEEQQRSSLVRVKLATRILSNHFENNFILLTCRFGFFHYEIVLSCGKIVEF